MDLAKYTVAAAAVALAQDRRRQLIRGGRQGPRVDTRGGIRVHDEGAPRRLGAPHLWVVVTMQPRYRDESDIDTVASGDTEPDRYEDQPEVLAALQQAGHMINAAAVYRVYWLTPRAQRHDPSRDSVVAIGFKKSPDGETAAAALLQAAGDMPRHLRVERFRERRRRDGQVDAAIQRGADTLAAAAIPLAYTLSHTQNRTDTRAALLDAVTEDMRLAQRNEAVAHQARPETRGTTTTRTGSARQPDQARGEERRRAQRAATQRETPAQRPRVPTSTQQPRQQQERQPERQPELPEQQPELGWEQTEAAPTGRRHSTVTNQTVASTRDRHPNERWSAGRGQGPDRTRGTGRQRRGQPDSWSTNQRHAPHGNSHNGASPTTREGQNTVTELERGHEARGRGVPRARPRRLHTRPFPEGQHGIQYVVAQSTNGGGLMYECFGVALANVLQRNHKVIRTSVIEYVMRNTTLIHGLARSDMQLHEMPPFSQGGVPVAVAEAILSVTVTDHIYRAQLQPPGRDTGPRGTPYASFTDFQHSARTVSPINFEQANEVFDRCLIQYGGGYGHYVALRKAEQPAGRRGGWVLMDGIARRDAHVEAPRVRSERSIDDYIKSKGRPLVLLAWKSRTTQKEHIAVYNELAALQWRPDGRYQWQPPARSAPNAGPSAASHTADEQARGRADRHANQTAAGQASRAASEQANRAADGQASRVDGEQASRVGGDQASHGERASHADGEQASHADGEQASHADGEQASHADGEQASHADGEQASHADGEQASHAGGEQASHADGEQASHADGEQASHNTGGQRRTGSRREGATGNGTQGGADGNGTQGNVDGNGTQGGTGSNDASGDADGNGSSGEADGNGTPGEADGKGTSGEADGNGTSGEADGNGNGNHGPTMDTNTAGRGPHDGAADTSNQGSADATGTPDAAGQTEAAEQGAASAPAGEDSNRPTETTGSGRPRGRNGHQRDSGPTAHGVARRTRSRTGGAARRRTGGAARRSTRRTHTSQ